MHADTILKSRAVFTGTGHTARPAAIALSEGRIVAVGGAEDVAALEGPGTDVLDFGDSFVMPGFHDSHLHFFHTALYGSPLALSYLGTSEEDCVDALAPLAARRPQGSWLLSQGWREYRWDRPRLPSKASLDAAYPDRPVAMYSGDAHTLWVNSAALQELGLSPDTVPPDDPDYERDGQGGLSGIIREGAAMGLMPRIMGSFSEDELAGVYRSLASRLVGQGITSVCDIALMPYPGLDFVRDDIFARLEGQGELPLRVHLFPVLTEDKGRFEAMQSRLTGSRLQAVGLKQFFDGVSSQHTAYLAEPYANARFAGDRGRPTIDPAAMRGLVMGAAAEGYPVRIHTIGNQAIHDALDIFAEARSVYGPLRHGQNCLEHLENLLPEDIGRLADLDVLATVQPMHITLDPGGPERDLGEGRVATMWPFKTFLDSGVKLAFGTDAPVVGTNPLDTLYAAVTRQDHATHEPQGGWLPQERITMAQAIRAYTLGSAQAAGRAAELGTLEAGKLADICVLDRDLLGVAPDEIQGTRVVATFVGGECVYGG